MVNYMDEMDDKENKETEENKENMDDFAMRFESIMDMLRDADARNEAIRKSVRQEEKKYNQKKSIDSKILRKAIISVLIAASLLCGTLEISKGLKSADISTDINHRIHSYSTVMDHSEDYEKNLGAIENFVGDNLYNHNDPKVSYEPWNDDNFLNYVVEASRADDALVEVRCALIAAYNVINEQFIEKQFNILFNRLKDNEEFINNTGLDLNKDNIWQALGYEDRTDFQMNARKDTKNMYLEYKRSNNGKGM